MYVNWVQAYVMARRAQGERFKIKGAYVVIFTNTLTYGAEYWVRGKGEIREKSLRCLRLCGVWGINYELKSNKKNRWEM